MGAPGAAAGAVGSGWAAAGRGWPLCATPPSPAIRRSSRLLSFFSLDIEAQFFSQGAILAGGAALGCIAGDRLAEHLALAQLGINFDGGFQDRPRKGRRQLVAHGAVHSIAAV